MSIKWGLAGGVVGMVLAGWLTYAVWQHYDEMAPVGISVESPEAKEIKKAPSKVITSPVRIRTGDTKAKLKLPKDVQENKNEQVVTATQVRASDRRQTVTTTIDTSTGETKTFTRQDEYPLFAVEPRGEIRLAYGYRTAGIGTPQPITRLSGSYDVLRVKAFTIGATASLDSDGRSFLGVGVAYRW